MLLMGNKTVISCCLPLPLCDSDDPMDYCPRPKAEGNSPPWSSLSPRGNSFYYSLNSHEITVYYTIQHDTVTGKSGVTGMIPGFSSLSDKTVNQGPGLI